MRNRTWVILGLAIVTGGVAAYLAFTYLQQPEDEGQQPAVQTTPVAVAAQPLQLGTVLQPQHVKMVEWPAAATPSGYAGSPSEVVGRGLLSSVETNEPLLPRKLAREEAGGGLPITIPSGMRALSVRVNDVVNVAGFVAPGSRVDVLVTMDRDEGAPATQLILDNVRVVSTGEQIQQSADGEPQQYSVATLLVTPEEAERLTMAATRGQIQLALRNPLDLDSLRTPGITRDEVITLQQQTSPAPQATAPARPRPPSQVQVEVYRGPDRSTSTVDTTTGGDQ